VAHKTLSFKIETLFLNNTNVCMNSFFLTIGQKATHLVPVAPNFIP